jgi:hypothetical protein
MRYAIVILALFFLASESFGYPSPFSFGKKSKTVCDQPLRNVGQYKLFSSPDEDWFVSAKKEGKNVSILYEGHGKDEALAEVLKDLGFEINPEEKKMDSGTYEPTVRDWPSKAKRSTTSNSGEKVSGRIFVPIGPEELKEKIEAAWTKLTPNKDERSRYEIRELTPTVQKDLRKVGFDMENTEWETSYWGNPKVGYQKLPNGLSYFGVVAGGDWESPVFFIIYWDGKQLRGYIPKDGNPWNKNTHEAYGNDDDADREAFKKIYEEELKKIPEDQVNEALENFMTSGIPFDEAKIVADIQDRIKPKGQ